MKLKNLDALIDEFAAMGVPSIDISVRLHGEEIYRRMEGYSDAAKTKPVNGRERYNVYSCSKPITVTAAMQLWERGKLGLEDKLSDYLPEFYAMNVREGGEVRPAKREITIRDLFTMSAGLTYDLWSENLRAARGETGGRCPTREVMKYLARDPLAFDPGERYNYSLCHDVIAALVEVISGERFGEYVKKNIFEPAGMENSTFLATDDERSKLAEQYGYDSSTKIYNPIGGSNGYCIGSEYESGGAGCVTSVDDYMKFLEGWRIGLFLKPSTLEMMTKNQLDEKRIKYYPLTQYGYGYGLGLRCGLDGSESTDFGWGGAAGAYLACDLKHDFTIFHAQHVLNSPNQPMRNLIPGAVRADLQ